MEEIKNNINQLRDTIQKARNTPEHIHLDQALEHLNSIESVMGENPELKNQLELAKTAILQSQSALKEREHSPKRYEESIEETIRVCELMDEPLCY